MEAWGLPAIYTNGSSDPYMRLQRGQGRPRATTMVKRSLSHARVSCFPSIQICAFPSIHSVLLAALPDNQHYFSLTPNQHQPPATSQPVVIFSHNNKTAPATSRTENILSLTTGEKFPSSAKSPYLCFLIALFFLFTSRHVFKTNCVKPLQEPNVLHVIRVSSKNIAKWTNQEYLRTMYWDKMAINIIKIWSGC